MSFGQMVLAGVAMATVGVVACIMNPEQTGKLINKIGIFDTTVNEEALKQLHSKVN